MESNRLRDLAALTHRYLGLRHGESTANVEGLVISDPARGVDGFGLTERGRAQVEAAVAAFVQTGPVRILSSDFARAWETAEIARALLEVDRIEPALALRERTFGRWEGGSNAAYATVWAADADDPTHTEGGVESVAAVTARTTALVRELEAGGGPPTTVVLVSHGDPLQILQTAFLRAGLGTHRQRPAWSNGELRPLELGTTP